MNSFFFAPNFTTQMRTWKKTDTSVINKSSWMRFCLHAQLYKHNLWGHKREIPDLYLHVQLLVIIAIIRQWTDVERITSWSIVVSISTLSLYRHTVLECLQDLLYDYIKWEISYIPMKAYKYLFIHANRLNYLPSSTSYHYSCLLPAISFLSVFALSLVLDQTFTGISRSRTTRKCMDTRL